MEFTLKLDKIRSFLIGRKQKVLVEGKASVPKPVLSGPQETPLDPLFSNHRLILIIYFFKDDE